MGGGHGCHYYLWWTKSSYSPVAHIRSVHNSIFVRNIYHHDRTGEGAVSLGNFDDYLALNLTTLADYSDFEKHPFTDKQTAFAQSTSPVKFIHGFPGSGKTYALWNAIQHVAEGNILYLTYSARLKETTLQYLNTLGSTSVKVQVYLSLIFYYLSLIINYFK